MKKLYVYFLAAALGISSLQARGQTQQKESKEGVSNEQQLAEQFGTDQLVDLPVNSVNRAVLTQVGNGNGSSIDQRTFGGAGNRVAILQSGNANTANTSQTGAGNVTTVKQMGNRNTVDSDIDGFNTESAIIQDGNNNRVNQGLSVDDRRYKVEQKGNNNQLNQQESGIAAPPGYEVYMQGNGIRMTIEQGIKIKP
ncbi:hypothetical protein [Hymenobacter algoricola]|uniref:Curlin n=1 Tax=Hymenobacter algoricola TaxID=486267 RepID=A0ABP7MNQ4_9BACT